MGYLKQRCQKELTREKPKARRERKTKNPREEEGESLASMLKAIHADIRTIKNDVKDNSSKVNVITSKIDELERNNERSEIENKRKFEDLKRGLALVEKSVMSKVTECIEPHISTLKTDLSSEMRSEMKQMFKEEMEKNYLRKKKPEYDEEASSEEE